jgi:hypothetical protein
MADEAPKPALPQRPASGVPLTGTRPTATKPSAKLTFTIQKGAGVPPFAAK